MNLSTVKWAQWDKTHKCRDERSVKIEVTDESVMAPFMTVGPIFVAPPCILLYPSFCLYDYYRLRQVEQV